MRPYLRPYCGIIMLEYLKFAAGWVVLMLIIVGVTLVVPFIAAKIDKMRENAKVGKRENMFSFGQTSFMEPAEGLDTQNQTEETAENKEKIADGQRTE